MDTITSDAIELILFQYDAIRLFQFDGYHIHL